MSQCSAIFPSWKEDVEDGEPGGAGDQDAAGVQEHHVALGDDPPFFVGGVGELLQPGGTERLHGLGAVVGQRVVLDVVRPHVAVDDGRVAPLERRPENLDGNSRLPGLLHGQHDLAGGAASFAEGVGLGGLGEREGCLDVGAQGAGFGEIGDGLHAGVVRLDEEGLVADAPRGYRRQLVGVDGYRQDRDEGAARAQDVEGAGAGAGVE